jgi:uncharacterized damage-inducible protein DinB
MNYYGAKELASSFQKVRQNTIVIAEEIGDEHYQFRPAEGARSIAETLFHIAVTPRTTHKIHAVDHLSDLAKFDFVDFLAKLKEEEKKPHSRSELLTALREDGEQFSDWLASLTDDFLAERVAMPGAGESKSRFELLLSTKEHEMHHRAQLMLVERMLGITPHLTRQMEERLQGMRNAKAGA